MSQAWAHNLEPVAVINKDLQYEGGAVYEIRIGNKERTPNIIVTQNAGFPNVNFTSQPPSVRHGLPRVVFLKWYVTVTVTGNVAANNTLIKYAVRDALRAFPMLSCMTNLQITLNNGQNNIPIQQILPALLQCNTYNEELAMYLSGCPTALDEFQSYNDPLLPAPAYGANWTSNSQMLVGTTADPQANFGYSYSTYRPARGAFAPSIPYPTAVQMTNVLGVMSFEIYEPLLISPFIGKGEKDPIIGINQFNITCQFGSMSRIWTRKSAVTANGETPDSVTSIAVNLSAAQQPELHVSWLTPNESVVVPNPVIYDWSEVQVYPQPNSFMSGVFQNLIPNVMTANIQLTQVPNRILIYAKRNLFSVSNATGLAPWLETDTFLKIEKCSINFDNRSGINASADSFDLWQQSVNNGLQMSWQQWSETRGSVYIIDITKNLTLSNIFEAPGQRLNKQFQAQLSFRNICGDTTACTNPAAYNNFPVTLYVVVINNGLMTIDSGNCVFQTSVTSTNDVSKALNKLEKLGEKDASAAGMYGGNIKRVGKFLGKAWRGLQSAKPVSRGLDVAHALAPVTGWRPHPAFQSAADIVGMGGNVYDDQGGADISRSELSKRCRLQINHDFDDDY